VTQHPLNPELTNEFDYLLGLLDDAARERMQSEVLENDVACDRVREAENELFDAYVRGALPARYRAPFEQRLLASRDGRRKLATARALERRGRRSRSWRWVAAVAGLIAAIGVPATWMRRSPEAPTVKPGAPAPRPAVIVLPQGATRSAEGIPVFRLPRGVAEVEAQAPKPPGTETDFEVEVRTGEGETRWRSGAVTAAPGAPWIPVRIPAAVFQPGPYEVVVTSRGSPLSFHYFRIE